MKIKRVVRIIVWGFCGFLIALLLLFQTPFVQQSFQNILIHNLKKNTNLEFEIGTMSGLLPFWCHCENIKVSSISKTSDNNKICHLEVGTLDLFINPFSLFYKTLTIEHLSLTHTKCHSLPETTEPAYNGVGESKIGEKNKTNFDIHIHHFQLDHVHLGKDLIGESFIDENFSFSMAGLISYDKTQKLFAKLELSLPSQDRVFHAIVEKEGSDRELTLSTHLKIPAKCQEITRALNKQGVNFDLPPIDLRISGKAPLSFWSSLFDSEKVELDSLHNFNGQVHGVVEAPPLPCQEWFLWQFGKKWELHSSLIITPKGEFILPALNLKSSNLKTEGQLGWTPSGIFIDSYLKGTINEIDLFIPDSLKEEVVVAGDLHFEGTINGSFSKPDLNFSYKTENLSIVYFNQNMSTELKELLQPHEISGDFALIFDDKKVSGSLSSATFLFDTQTELFTQLQWQKDESFTLNNLRFKALESVIEGNLSYNFNAKDPYHADLHFQCADLNLFEPLINKISNSTIVLEGSLKGDYTQEEKRANIILNPTVVKINSLLFLKGEILLNNIISHDKIPYWEVSAFIDGGAFEGIPFEAFALKTALTYAGNIPYSLEVISGLSQSYSISSRGTYTNDSGLFSIQIDNLAGQWLRYPFLLQKPTLLSFTEERTSIDAFTIDIGSNREAELNGSFQRVESEFSLKLNMNHFPLEMINPFNEKLPMSGQISSEVLLTQKEGEVSGHLNLNMDEIDFLDIAYDTIPFLNFSLSGIFHQHSFKFEGELTGFSDKPFHIQSEIPFSISFEPFDISLKKDLPFHLDINGQAPLTPLTSFLIDETIIIQAVADVQSRFSGTLNNPELSGTLSVQNGTIESIKTGALAKNVELEIEGSGSQFVINKFLGKDPKGGTLSATGFMKIDFNHGISYDIDVMSQNFRLVELDPVTADVNTHLNFHGSEGLANLTGTISVAKSSVIIPKEPPVSIPFVEVTYCNILCEHIKELIATPSPLNLFLDINVEIPANLSIEGRGLISEWRGIIHIQGKAPDLTYSGNLEVVSGEFVFSNRKFELTSGQIQVNSLKTRDIFINLNAELQLSQFLINVNIKGSLNQPQVTFTANPSLSTSEILAWILFDTDLSEISAFQALQITQALIVLSGRYAGPDYLGKIKEALGLDVLDISSADIDTADVTFQVGKYISKGIFVGVNKSVSGDRDAISIQAKVTRRLSLQADLGGDAGGKLILKWYKSY